MSGRNWTDITTQADVWEVQIDINSGDLRYRVWEINRYAKSRHYDDQADSPEWIYGEPPEKDAPNSGLGQERLPRPSERSNPLHDEWD